MLHAATIKKKYTYQDYLKMPEDKRYELIEGELLMTPSPKMDHQRISLRLVSRMERFVEEKSLGEVLEAPADVYLDEESVVQPDILFISKDRIGIIGEDNVKGAPDLVVEILSESTAYRDTVQKKVLYARFGVKEYWIVAPREKFIEIYSLKNKEYGLVKTYFYDDALESQVLKGFRVSLKEIF
ncbi:MAG: Uma2 family endonuclease [Nitrospirota bacterium]